MTTMNPADSMANSTSVSTLPTIAQLQVPPPNPMPEPLPLNRLRPLKAELDPTLLPPSLQAWVSDEAMRMGMPVAAIAVPALVTAAAAIGSTARLQVKRYDDGWTEPAGLWGMVVGRSGIMKTPALGAGVRFAEEIERERRTSFDNGRAQREAKRSLTERQMEALKRKAQKPLQPAELALLETELTRHQAQFDAIPKEAPRFLLKDVTMEKLGMIVDANPRGIVMVRDELGGLLNTMHRKGHEGARSFYTEAYSANASHSFDRVGRESTFAYPLSLSLVGAIQPSVLADHTKDLDVKGGDDGFFARFQLIAQVLPEDTVIGADRHKNLAAEAQAEAVYRTLDAEAITWVESEPRGSYRLIQLDDDAQEHLDTWRRKHREYLLSQEGQANGALAAHLAKSDGAAARLCLVQHLIDKAAGNTAPRVTLEQARRATGLTDYFIENAKALYLSAAHPKAQLAKRIAGRITQGKVWNGMTMRDLRQQFDSASTRAEDLREALHLLAELHWLWVEERPNPNARPSEVIHLNPALPEPPTDLQILPS